MAEDTQSWKLGEARITSIVGAETDGIPPQLFFPAAGPDMANLSMRVQAFVVEIGGRRVVVDPCIGNGKPRQLPFWNDQSWPFMERFRAAGFDPAEVDL